ncbi:hypothetical protein D3C80_1096480 [compost metagenome]
MRSVTDRQNLLNREDCAQRHGGFHQQTFREQTVAGFGRPLDQFMRNKGFCALHATDKQRRFSLKLAERKGQLSQNGIFPIAKRQRSFAFFIKKRIGAEANGKLLLVFSRQSQ